MALTEAQQRVVEENMRAGFFHAAREIRRSPRMKKRLGRDDIISAVQMGVIRAAERWDPAKGSFTTWCRLWVKQELQYAVRQSYSIPLPHVAVVYNRNRTVGESTRQAIVRVVKARNLGEDLVSKEMADRGMSPEEKVSHDEFLDYLFGSLTAIQGRVIRRIYFRGMSLKEISALEEVSYQRVQQIHQQALKKLSRVLTD